MLEADKPMSLMAMDSVNAKAASSKQLSPQRTNPLITSLSDLGLESIRRIAIAEFIPWLWFSGQSVLAVGSAHEP